MKGELGRFANFGCYVENLKILQGKKWNLEGLETSYRKTRLEIDKSTCFARANNYMEIEVEKQVGGALILP